MGKVCTLGFGWSWSTHEHSCAIKSVLVATSVREDDGEVQRGGTIVGASIATLDENEARGSRGSYSSYQSPSSPV
ncbi:hypothetical protein PG991_012301 [Apiospora marii]|uniref:Uncharacterized protein n=1 Tax=Apiospora marii TaxID=335849 RepID=A0ABR1R9C0_9PEZI